MTHPTAPRRAPTTKPAAGPCLVTTLPNHASALLVARRAVDSFGLSTPHGEDARLIVTELVTNALRHGEGTASLSLCRRSDGSLSGSVGDDGEGFEPPPASAAGTDVGGLGLKIVDTLSEEWGVGAGQTRVWFELAAGAASRG